MIQYSISDLQRSKSMPWLPPWIYAHCVAFDLLVGSHHPGRPYSQNSGTNFSNLGQLGTPTCPAQMSHNQSPTLQQSKQD